MKSEIESGVIRAQYSGGGARVMSKMIVTTGNAFVPRSLGDSYPLLAAGVVGLVSSPFSNFFKMAQINRSISPPVSYPEFFKRFPTKESLHRYKTNTSVFAINETMRSVTCFGVSAWIQQVVSNWMDKDMLSGWDHCKIVLSGGVGSAIIETAVSGPGEIYTAAQGNLKETGSRTQKVQLSPRFFIEFFEKNNSWTRPYFARALSVLLLKNIICNTMLSGSHYKSRLYEQEHAVTAGLSP